MRATVGVGDGCKSPTECVACSAVVIRFGESGVVFVPWRLSEGALWDAVRDPDGMEILWGVWRRTGCAVLLQCTFRYCRPNDARLRIVLCHGVCIGLDACAAKGSCGASEASI